MPNQQGLAAREVRQEQCAIIRQAKQWLHQKSVGMRDSKSVSVGRQVCIRIKARASGQEQRWSGHHLARPQGRHRSEAKPRKPSQGQHWGGPRQSTRTAVAQLQCSTEGPVVQPQLHSTSERRRGRSSLLPFFTTALPSRGPGLGLSQFDSNLASQTPRRAMRSQLSRGHGVLPHLP